MLIQNRTFANELEKQAFVNECELDFDLQMRSLTETVIARPEAKVVTLSGPTCSGKTVTAFNLTRDIMRAGRRIYSISIDDFYRSRDEIITQARENGEEPDFDSLSSIDFAGFERCVEDIYASKSVLLPKFDFVSGKRSELVAFNPREFDVVLFEGIQANYPEVCALLGRHPYISISTNVRRGINVCGQSFSPREVRLARRIVRDIRTRAASPDMTFAMWETTVVGNEDKNILPYENDTAIRIDSLMPYEINVIKRPLLAAFAAMPPGSPYTAWAKSYIDRLECIEEIDAAFVPPESLMREFLG